jgi:hypothetical protein
MSAASGELAISEFRHRKPVESRVVLDAQPLTAQSTGGDLDAVGDAARAQRGAWTGRDERRAFGSTTQRRFSIQVELLDSPFT